jgi:hypothetical protein
MPASAFLSAARYPDHTRFGYAPGKFVVKNREKYLTTYPNRV